MPHGLHVCNDTGPSVRSSVCLFHLAPQPRRAAGLLLWARRAGDIDLQRRGRSANASSVTLIAGVGG